jgi:CDP-glycerol glycerophosphotransferase (TagB/SpsB family)
MKLQTLINLFKEWQQFRESRHIEKDNNIWVFGAIRGQKYFDNAKYFFEYVNNNTDIQAIWISKNAEVVDHVRQKGFEAFHEESAEGRHYAERARVAIITHRGSRDRSDIPFHLLSKETFIVQLWHGIPLKKIAFDDEHFSYTHDESSLTWRIKAALKRYFFPFRLFVNQPNLIPASSEELRQLYASAFRVPPSNVALTGYPRNDRILHAATNSAEHPIRKIIYMPTFRGDENSDFNLLQNHAFSIEDIDRFLTENNMQLDIKLHPFNYPSDQVVSSIATARSVSLLACDDIYEVIQDYQLLITDYSSIYFDFLLLNRPIIFTPFDIESYLGRQRDFYFPYEEVTPGPKAASWPEVLSLIHQYAENPSWYSKERKDICDRFHTIKDKNCERLYREITNRVA